MAVNFAEMPVPLNSIELDGEDLRRQPIEVRKSTLSRGCGEACALGCGGIVSKRFGHIGQGGRIAGSRWRLLVANLRASPGWLRAKIPTILTWASVLIGIAAGALFFLPRLTIEPSGPYDPSNPSPITFVISNVNIVPLRNVQPFVGVCSISYQDEPHPDCNGPTLSKLVFGPWLVKWLDADEKYQIALEELIRIRGESRQIQSANITIGVIYTPWRMPAFWRNTKEFRFVTKKRSDGKIYWISTPLNR